MKRVILILIGLSFATPAAAQTQWRYSSGLAGATAGGALLYLYRGASAVGCIGSTDADCGEFDSPIQIAVVGGLGLIGYLHGRDVDRTLARGEMISAWTRRRLRAQLVVTGVLLPPMLLSGMKPDGTRQTLSWIGAASGAILGYHLQRRYELALWPRTRVGVSPTMNGMTMQVSMPW